MNSVKKSEMKIVSLLLILGVAVTIIGIAAGSLLFKKRTFCIDVEDEYKCITEKAIADQDPSYCSFLDAGRSDPCVDRVIDSASDPAICKKIFQTGIQQYCFERLSPATE